MEYCFPGADPPEVCARVLLRVIERLYTQNPSSLNSLKRCLDRLPVFSMPSDSNDMMSLAIASLGHYGRLGMKTRVWANHVIMASRAGYSFRRCFYFDYKAGRSDPRVTNRGVMGGNVPYVQALLEGRTIEIEGNGCESDCNDSRSGLDNGDTAERGTLPPKVVERRLRVARAGRK